ncbi:TRAP transporter substrate-binding protein [Pseudomonas sp. H11T01]|uniref:TRAP transporter substrate-binding protein n=1 Tax=Pseudomonas sp. H11T01 TaxID=3402749 RepID=UPI003AC20CE5
MLIDIAIPHNATFDQAAGAIQKGLEGIATVRNLDVASADSAIKSVMEGETDLAVVPVSALSKFVPPFGIYGLPFTFSEIKPYSFFMKSQLQPQLAEQLNAQGLQALGGVWYGGTRVIASQLPRRSPWDFKDTKLAVSSDDWQAMDFSGVGAKSIKMSDTDMASALATGAVDAAEVPWDRVTKIKAAFVTQSDHRYSGLIAIYKASRFSALPDPARERITQVMNYAEEYVTSNIVARESEAIDAVQSSPTITWMGVDEGVRAQWQVALANRQASAIEMIGPSLVSEARITPSYTMNLSKASPTFSINWNAWFQSSPRQLKNVLVAGKPYDFVLDLGRGIYPGALSSGISGLLQEEIAADPDSDEIHLLVRPVLMGGILEPAPGSDFRARRFNVHRDRLPARPTDEPLREKARQHLITLSDLAKALSVDAPMVWPLIARQAGCAQVVLSIWDAAGLRPLDYIVVSLPVSDVGQQNPPACDTSLRGGELVSGLERLLEVGKSARQTSPTDAALHLFDSIPKGEGDPTTVAVFVDRSEFKTAKDQGKAPPVYAWELAGNLTHFLEQDSMLPASIASTRQHLKTPQPYTEVVRQMNNMLFNGRTPGDQRNADAARAAMQRLTKRVEAPVVLVRYFDPWGEMQNLPLALLGADAPDQLFSRRITVVQPLQDAQTLEPGACFSGWDFAIPRALDGVNAESAELLMKDDWRMQGRDVNWYQNNTDLLKFMTQADTPSAASSALVLLAHHGKGDVTFSASELPGRVLDSDMRRHFTPGSVAVLAACSTLGVSAASQTFVNMLVRRGVGAVVASPFPVDSDFGTRLSVSFVAVAQQLRASGTSARVIDIFNQALQKTIDTYGKGSGYADMALEFQIIGDPELRMCAAPTASNQQTGGLQ